jgi:hypothetical protein
MRSRIPWVAAGLSVLSASAGWSCDGPGNSGRSTLDPAFVRAVPWLNGVLPVMEGGDAVIPNLPAYPPIASGLADPGSQRLDCSGLADLEFSKLPGDVRDPSKEWYDTFEPLTSDPTETGIAAGWSSYDDLTPLSFHTPGDASWYPGLDKTFRAIWGMAAEKIPGPSCDGKPNDWVMHFRGGLFRKWGGGISHAFTDPLGRYRADATDTCAPGVDFCPPPVPAGAKVDTAGLPLTAASGDQYLQSHDFFDVSAYDGIAFWARRGPEGFDRALVILTDKFTSSRLARENQQYCRRVRECYTACASGVPCSLDPTSPTPVYRCFDPSVGLPNNISIESEFELMYPRCGKSACTSPDTYLDPDFDSKACRPYTFPAADESGEYCWSEGDTPPPSRDDRCQDGWQTSVDLTLDWTFYALPFSRFGQVGFGKRAPYMDLKSLDTIAFGAVMGWSDVYFDNVTLYRRKR